MDQGVDRPAAPARRRASIATHGPIEPIEYTPSVDYTPDVFDAVDGVAADDARPRRSRSPTRPSATPPPTPPPPRPIAAAVRHDGRRHVRRSRAARSRRPSARCTKKLVRKRIVDEGVRIDGRGPRDLRPLSAEVGVLPTAHGSGLFQRGETQVLNVATLGMPRMDQMLDTLGARRPASATCTTTTSRRSPTARPAASVRPSAARSATARSPSGRCCRCVPSQEEFAYTLRLVSEVLASNGSTSMASVCALDAVADGRRRADQGAGRRHRHGPRLRRGQVHDAHRHPRRRGRVRRHGLQGRRHRRLRHRAAARHQDRRHPRRRAGRGAASRPRTPASRSSRS